MINIKLKGFAKFRAKIPALSGFKIIFFIIFIVLVIIFNITVLRFFTLFPITFPSFGPFSVFFPVIGVLLMESTGIVLVYQMWAHRDKLKEKYGELSYQRIVFTGFAGVVIVLSIAVFTIISFLIWQNPLWSANSLQILVIPLTSLILGFENILHIISLIFGAFFIILGLLMIARALQIFGFDYMAVIYLYFPEESEMQNHEIFSLLRHPTYAAAMLLCLGGVIINQNIYTIIFWIIYYLGFYIHIHFVEEKELIERFGDSYLDYRKEVPPFFVKPKNYYRFLKFVFTRKI